MIRQITLEVNAENGLQRVAKEQGVRLAILDCKPFNRTGMSLLLALKGVAEEVRAVVAAIRQTEGVRQAIEGEGAGDAALLLVVLERPPICRTSNEAAIICLDCPLSSENQPPSWRFLARRSSDLRHILGRLSREGIQTRIQDIAPLESRPTLTGRQKEIMRTAVDRGYFEFPRKVSLTELSKLVGVKPSTLSEVLRSAERRIMENALGTLSRES